MRPAVPQSSNSQRELAVKFKVVKFLGKGSYGSVFLVQRLVDGQQYALKEMDVRSMSQAEREDSVNEIRLLASIQHANVTSYNEAFLDGNRLCIIMEYASEGDLAKLIKKHSMMKRPIPEELIWRYFIQVATGLAALHNARILHRDIKPGNIMLFEGGVAKIGDLGIAKLLTHTHAAKTQIGTPHYMPPEIWRSKPYAYSSDTWAMGCLLYELATLNVPFEARSMSELRYKVLKGTYPPVPSTFSRDLQQLVRECLDPNPDRRPTMDQVLNSPAVKTRMNAVPREVANVPPSTAGSGLLDTIKVPRNFAMIKGKLPPAQYATDMAVGMNMAAMSMDTINEGSEEGDPTRPLRQQQAAPMRAPAAAAAAAVPSVKSKQQYAVYGAAAAAAGGGVRNGAGNIAAGRPGGGGIAAERLPAMAGAKQYNEVPVAPMPGGYGNKARAPPPMQVPAVRTPPSGHQGNYTPTSQGWYDANGAGAAASKVSESHANYGAFYHNAAYTPTSAARQQQQQQQQLAGQQGGQQGQYHAMPPPWMQQAQKAYMQSPSNVQAAAAAAAASRNHAGGRANGDFRLPALQQHPQQPQRPAPGMVKPPPWNYGARDKNNSSNGKAPRGGGGGGGGGALPGIGGANGYGGNAANGANGNASRYPPPQWAPQPRRW